MKHIFKKILSPGLRKEARVLERTIKGFFLRGNSVECPCCGAQFSRFLPFGAVPRDNALCPNCGSLERHRLIWLYLRGDASFRSGKMRLLHFAPEDVLRRKFSEIPGLDYVTADLYEADVDVRCDIQQLPFDDGSFDFILCSHVLEHVEDDRRAMRELYRVLRPPGRAILQTPMDLARERTFEDAGIRTEADRLRVFGQIDHVRIYGRDYYQRLEEAGFSLAEENFIGRFSPEEIRKYGLMKDEFLCICRK